MLKQLYFAFSREECTMTIMISKDGHADIALFWLQGTLKGCKDRHVDMPLFGLQKLLLSVGRMFMKGSEA